MTTKEEEIRCELFEPISLEAGADVTYLVNGIAKEEDVDELRFQMVEPSDEMMEILAEQMKARLRDGHGETIYELGTGGN